ncbi:opsin 7, group member c [Alosa pseudoharengus]|uniref:opsin 7, group member c n=1 Tax=Alosa pseudoharengus TaxID=34774 RepID=UPI003F89E11B
MGNASEIALFFSRISMEHDYFMGTVYAVFCVLSLLGNGVLLLVAYRKRSSLKPAEFFIINLSVSDLGMTLTLFPLAIPSSFSHRWLFGDVVCQGYAFCGVFFGLCSLTNLTALSSVCCLKVCFPHYGNKFSSAHALLLVAGVWGYASIFAIGPLARWGQYGPEPYGTACCIDWYAPADDMLAMSYIICLFLFCYVVPCTIIFLSYTFILLTVRGSRQAVQQHVSPQTKTTNAHTLIVKLSVAVCIGFLSAWSPYAIVAMWAAFVDRTIIPPFAFALAAIFAKSSTIYNPVVYLLFKPNFRKSLCRDTAQFRHKICSSTGKGSPNAGLKDPSKPASSQRSHKDITNSTRLSNGLPESHGACLHCAEVGGGSGGTRCHLTTPQRTARMLTDSGHSEVMVCQLPDKLQDNFL